MPQADGHFLSKKQVAVAYLSRAYIPSLPYQPRYKAIDISQLEPGRNVNLCNLQKELAVMSSFWILSIIASSIFATTQVSANDRMAINASAAEQTAELTKFGNLSTSLTSTLFGATGLKINQKPETFADRVPILDETYNNKQDWEPPDNEQRGPDPGHKKIIDPVTETDPEGDPDPVIDPLLDEEPAQVPGRIVDPPQKPDRSLEADELDEPGFIPGFQYQEDKDAA